MVQLGRVWSAPTAAHAIVQVWRRCRRALTLAAALAGTNFLSPNGAQAERVTLDFNVDWRFIKADPAGAAQPAFDDREWAQVSTPHTFNDTDTFDDWSPPGHRGEYNQWAGRTWYRKSFVLPESFRGRRVFIEFEAARQLAEVYINGRLLGTSRNGFIPFGFDLTPALSWDGTNVLAVMCDNRFMMDPAPENSKTRKGKGENGGLSLTEISARVNAAIPEEVDAVAADQLPWNNPHWHPAHGGLYRNVRLYVTDPVHISLPLYSFLATAGPYVYASEVSAEAACIGVEVPVQNESATDCEPTVTATVLDVTGKTVLELNARAQVAAGGTGEFKCAGTLRTPRLWEPGYPYLYRVICALEVGGTVVDSCEVPLGIRKANWDAQTGLSFNGRALKLHGWGQKPTDEWPGLGAAQPDWLHYLTVQMMKEAGANFIRWGHCAGPPASIVAADRLGIIVDQPGVDGESDTRGAAWKIRAAAFRDAIIYFRNNPSILIWEGGNQKVSADHARELSGYIAQFDPRGGRVYAHRRADKATAAFLQVAIGTEGGREIAALPVVEGEYDREESPRRVWDNFSPPGFGYTEAKGQTYQLTSEEYAVNQVAQYWRKLGGEDHCGGANWIFSDSTSGGRVSCEVARVSGEVDGARLPKEAYYACQAMFRPDPQVHLIGHWTYPAGTKKTVYVVSNGDEVELLVNGKSLGRRQGADRFLFTFPDVVWAAGEIKAVAYRNSKAVAEEVKRTAGKPLALRLTPLTAERGLRADGSDVALVDVEAVDEQGQRCPTFESRVAFELTGPAVWRGGYNSGRTNSINQTWLGLEAGVNRVALRATRDSGRILLKANCEGLRPGRIEIFSTPVSSQAGLCPASTSLPPLVLPAQRSEDFKASPSSPQVVAAKSSITQTGRFIRTLAYSGPAVAVQVQPDAGKGKRIYVDGTELFDRLPAELAGADWVQGASADKLYSAADLMELAVPSGTTVFVAHDDSLARPAWLAAQFRRTSLSLRIGRSTMTLFQHTAAQDESLTLGGNTSDLRQQQCKMYVVFVKGRLTLSSSEVPGARLQD